MLFRSLFSILRYSRSRQESMEEAGLIIARRLRELASGDAQPKTVSAPSSVESCAGYSEESLEINAHDPDAPAVKTAA